MLHVCEWWIGNRGLSKYDTLRLGLMWDSVTRGGCILARTRMRTFGCARIRRIDKDAPRLQSWGLMWYGGVYACWGILVVLGAPCAGVAMVGFADRWVERKIEGVPSHMFNIILVCLAIAILAFVFAPKAAKVAAIAWVVTP